MKSRHTTSRSWEAEQSCTDSYALSLNGFVGSEDQRVEVPTYLYDDHLQIFNGLSATRRINRLGVVPVTDSLYLKRNWADGVAGSTEPLRLCGS